MVKSTDRRKAAIFGDRLILSRVLLCALGYVSLLLAINEPESLNSKMVESGGAIAWTTVYITLVLNTIALLDIIVNDVVYKHLEVNIYVTSRYLIWSVLASIWMMYTFVLLKTELSFWLAMVYLIYSLGCLMIAVLDTLYESATKRMEHGAEIRL